MSNFVTRSGNQYVLDGRRYRFVGVNNYPLIHNSSPYSSGQLDTFFGYCNTDGVGVVRSWCFDRTPYNSGGSGNVAGNFQYINDNLISNGNFESGTTGWQLGSDFTRSSTTAALGSWSIRQVSTSGFDNFTTTNDATGIDVTANTDYKLVFFVKCALSSGSGPQIQVNSGSAYGTTLGNIGALIDTAGAWSTQTISFNSGNNSKVWIRVFNNNGNNTVYYDGFYLFPTSGGYSFREATFAQLDLVLDRARAAGVRMSLVLTNGANEFTDDGLKQSYCRNNNYLNGTSLGMHDYGDAFHTNSTVKTRFKSYLSQLANRVNTVNGRTYKSDDTIFAWELINEGRYRNETYSGDSNSGTSSSTFVTTMKTWYDEMADYLKSTLVVSQMVGTGGAGQFYDYVRGDPTHNNSGYGLDYNLDHAGSSFDYADTHLYPYSDNSPYFLTAYGSSQGVNTARTCTLSASGSTITVTLASHGFNVGQRVSIFDVSNASSDTSLYESNIATVLTTPSTSTFTYTGGGSPSDTSADGWVRAITQTGLVAQLKEYATVAHTTLNKPVVIGEYGLVKGNTQNNNVVISYTKADNLRWLFKTCFDQLDYDGIFIWHYTHLFDDNNFNIKPDGVHTGGNANSNANDDDTIVRNIMREYGTKFKLGRPITP